MERARDGGSVIEAMVELSEVGARNLRELPTAKTRNRVGPQLRPYALPVFPSQFQILVAEDFHVVIEAELDLLSAAFPKFRDGIPPLPNLLG
jgi:hypothetical protein